MALNPLQIKNLYEQAFESFDGKIKTPKIEIEFYPYVNVNCRIKSRDGKVSVRISELLKDAPAKVQKALSQILVAKLLGKKVPVTAQKTYRQYIDQEDFQTRVIEHKRRTGTKIITSAQGKCFDLEKLFYKLNLVYFQNEIPKPTLSWSKQKTYRRLGHHDPVHRAIIISRSLDEKYVPKYVVEYVLYHEMLHIKHPVYQKNGRRCVHTSEFKRDEEKFPYFEQAEKWIDDNIARIKRSAKRKKGKN